MPITQEHVDLVKQYLDSELMRIPVGDASQEHEDLWSAALTFIDRAGYLKEGEALSTGDEMDIEFHIQYLILCHSCS